MSWKHHASGASWLAALLLPVIAAGSAQVPTSTAGEAVTTTWAVDLAAPLATASAAIGPLSTPAVVYVGEVHDRLGDHVNQLAVIMALVQRGLHVAVGLEMFAASFQGVLDDYVAGRTGLRDLLRDSEYFQRWGYDARHYQPILDYARRQRLPLLALNAPAELTNRVGEVGIDGLDADERAMLPTDLLPASPGYRDRLQAVFREHAGLSDSDIERFIDVQLTWDESMAAAAAAFLAAHPDHVLVVLAGNGHVSHGHGIPPRLRARLHVDQRVVLGDADIAGGDIYLPVVDASLAPAGRLGVAIRPGSDGAVVDSLADDGPARRAGLRVDDVIIAIDAEPVDSYAALRLALFDKRPGSEIVVSVRRDDDELAYPLALY